MQIQLNYKNNGMCDKIIIGGYFMNYKIEFMNNKIEDLIEYLEKIRVLLDNMPDEIKYSLNTLILNYKEEYTANPIGTVNKGIQDMIKFSNIQYLEEIQVLLDKIPDEIRKYGLNTLLSNYKNEYTADPIGTVNKVIGDMIKFSNMQYEVRRKSITHNGNESFDWIPSGFAKKREERHPVSGVASIKEADSVDIHFKK